MAGEDSGPPRELALLTPKKQGRVKRAKFSGRKILNLLLRGKSGDPSPPTSGDEKKSDQRRPDVGEDLTPKGFDDEASRGSTF